MSIVWARSTSKRQHRESHRQLGPSSWSTLGSSRLAR